MGRGAGRLSLGAAVCRLVACGTGTVRLPHRPAVTWKREDTAKPLDAAGAWRSAGSQPGLPLSDAAGRELPAPRASVSFPRGIFGSLSEGFSPGPQ